MKLWELLEERDRTGQAYNRAQRALEAVVDNERGSIYAWYKGDSRDDEILFVGGYQACLDWGQGWPEHEIHQYDGTVIIPISAQADPKSYAPRDLIQARLYPCIVNTPNYTAAIAWLKENEKDES